MSSNQPAKKVRFEAYLTPENYDFLYALSVGIAQGRRPSMSDTTDQILRRLRLRLRRKSLAEKEKAPNVISV